jgi:hypothetical protein
VAAVSALPSAPIATATLVLAGMRLQGNIVPLRCLLEYLKSAEENGGKWLSSP